jgi:hypothetical protein
MSSDQAPGADAFERSRQRRRGVRQASFELEGALARPAGQDPKGWFADAADRLQSLGEAFQIHATQSEGPDGLLGEIIEQAPRLANSVQRIKQEHQDILEQISDLEATASRHDDVERIAGLRERSLRLLQVIAIHRQRGADLIYEAFSGDIEGSD